MEYFNFFHFDKNILKGTFPFINSISSAESTIELTIEMEIGDQWLIVEDIV